MDLTRTDYESADAVRACARKRAYDEKHAKRAAARIRDEAGAAVAAYACRRCGCFHVGRVPGQ